MCRILSNRLEWEAQVCVGGEREAGGVAGPHLPQLAPAPSILSLGDEAAVHGPLSVCTLATWFHFVSLDSRHQLWRAVGSDKNPDLSRPEPLMQPGARMKVLLYTPCPPGTQRKG